MTHLSLSGNICKDGAITAVLAVAAFLVVFLIRLVLHVATQMATKVKTTQHVTKKHHWLENLLITPFVPSTLESYIAIIYFTWFTFTIPMAITRFYQSRWANQVLSQQGPFNVIAALMGCEGLNINAINYTEAIPCPTETNSGPFGVLRKQQESAHDTCRPEYQKALDFYFGHHLFIGICWLSFGALQIFWARHGWSSDPTVRKLAHKTFGYCVALIAFGAHMVMATSIAIYNPVSQVWMIQMQYFGAIVDSILLIGLGILYRRVYKDKGNAMHMVRMFFGYTESVFGSGAVRLTAWMLWLVGHFFPYDTRILIDRSVCQTDATPMGSAQHCWKPVFLNLAMTDALIMWMQWIFLCLDIAKFDKADKKAMISKAKQLLIALGLFIFLVAVDANDMVTQIVIALYALVVKVMSFRLLVAQFLHDPNLYQVGGTNWQKFSRFAEKSLLTLYQIPYGEEEEDHLHED